MHSVATFAALVAMGSFMCATGSPLDQSTRISILFPTGAEAVTAAPPVPTFGTQPVAGAVDVADAALAKAIVNNHCNFPVYLYSCDEQGCGAEVTIAANTGTWSSTYTSKTGDGVSIKIGTTPGEVQKAILQFEYTNKNGLVYFDASQVNGNPFSSGGYTLKDGAGLDKWCPPPCDHSSCPFIFTTPTNGVVYNTALDNNISLSLCKHT